MICLHVFHDVLFNVYDRDSLGEEDELALQSEVDILSQLDHPNVVKLYEIFDEGDCMYLVLELMSGGEVNHCNIVIDYYSYLTESLRKSIIQRKKQLTLLDPLSML